jgi:hypothetical protein
MRTPAGSECPFYYQDFHRGRSIQECRLIDRTPKGGTYTPDLCSKCRVPRIILANACKNLVLEAHVNSRFFGLRRSIKITAMCTRSLENVPEPEIGCGECHLEMPEFINSENNP